VNVTAAPKLHHQISKKVEG